MTARRPITRSRVGDTAFDLVRRDGFDALSLRGVASALGARAPSLYEHVRDKEEIVDLVVDRILTEAATTWDPPDDWAQLLRYTARWWHEVLVQHPSLLASVQRRPQLHPAALRSVESVLESLARAGWSRDDALAVYVQLFGFVTGMAAAETMRRRRTRRPADVRAAIDALPESAYPAVRAAREDLATLATADHFEAALELWARAVEALHSTRRRRGLRAATRRPS